MPATSISSKSVLRVWYIPGATHLNSRQGRRMLTIRVHLSLPVIHRESDNQISHCYYCDENGQATGHSVGRQRAVSPLAVDHARHCCSSQKGSRGFSLALGVQLNMTCINPPLVMLSSVLSRVKLLDIADSSWARSSGTTREAIVGVVVTKRRSEHLCGSQWDGIDVA